MDKDLAFYFHDLSQSQERIDIGGVAEWTEVLQFNRHHFQSSTLSDRNLIAISWKGSGDSMNQEPRHFGVLEMDDVAQTLRWVYSGHSNVTSNLWSK
jgi:hypothetical protein